MKRVILDTNFLMIPGSLGVDIFSELKSVAPGYKVCIIDKTIHELSWLKEKSAVIALQMIDKFDIQQIKTERNDIVDKLILNEAKQGVDLVGTQDKELKNLLKGKGVDIVVLRKKKYLKVIKT